jgi:hypothetical protein
MHALLIALALTLFSIDVVAQTNDARAVPRLHINWDADLVHLATELPKMHPHPFHKVTREAFMADVEQLRARAPRMQPHEVIVDMARIVATLGDGHTRVTLPLDPGHGFFQGHSKTAAPKDPSLMFRATAERYEIRDDGLYTRSGKRVTRIGKMTAEAAIAAVMPVAHGENLWQKREIAAGYLSVPEVLHARGVIDRVEDVLWSGGLQPAEAGALKSAAPQKPWRFEYLPEKKAVVFTFDEIANTPEETLAAFAEKMFRFIDEHPVEKLIIDLRNNWGGNGSLNRYVVHGLIRAKKLQAPGSVFALTSRRTFSAAMFLMIALEQQTSTIFIGEPTGGAPNGYGDSKKLILPESGITVRISSLYWQKSDPRDKRDTIAPHVHTSTPMEVALDYFGGTPSSAITGTWKGQVSIEHERVDVTIVDGKVITPDLQQYKFVLRAGTKRLAGMMYASGLEFLVTATR